MGWGLVAVALSLAACRPAKTANQASGAETQTTTALRAVAAPSSAPVSPPLTEPLVVRGPNIPVVPAFEQPNLAPAMSAPASAGSSRSRMANRPTPPVQHEAATAIARDRTTPGRAPNPAAADRFTPVMAPALHAPARVARTNLRGAPVLAANALRGLWVDAFGPGFRTPAEVDQLVARTRNLGLNALFIQAVKRGDCYCRDSAYPMTLDPAVPAGFDPLADVVSKAHANGLQVHAWVIVTAVWRTSQPDPGPGHVFHDHNENSAGGDWLSRSSTGAVTSGPDYSLDPGAPGVAAFVAAGVASLVGAYDLDGVQLDRVRYPDGDWGYNPAALARFAAQTGFVGAPNSTVAQWVLWRQAQVTNIVARAFAAVKAVKPSAWVSAATITYGAGPMSLEGFADSRAAREVLQDWPSWARLGILDLNVPMNYKRESSASQAAGFRDWNTFAASVAPGSVAPGIAAYLNSPRGTADQVRAALTQPGATGFVLYSYRTATADVDAGEQDGDSGWRELSGILHQRGLTPAQPRAFGAAPLGDLRVVTGRVLRDGQPVDGLTVSLSGADRQPRTVTTDSDGVFVVARAPEGEVTLTAQGGSSVTMTVSPGRVTVAPDLAAP